MRPPARPFLGIARRSYRLLLLAYPRDFRRRVGRDMAEVFSDLCDHEIRTNGAPGLLRFGFRTLNDVARNGLGERWARGRKARRADRPAPRRDPEPPQGDPSVYVFFRDLRFAARTLFKQPLFSLSVVFVLALGIAGTTAIFSVFNGMFLRPLPFDDPDRLVNVDVSAPQWNLEYVAVNYIDFNAWREQNQTFEAIAVVDNESMNMSLDGEASRVQASLLSHDIFDVLGVEPVLGRPFTADEDKPGAEGVVLLGHALWQDRFAADPAVLGKTLMLDSEAHTIIGVMPPEAIFTQGDLWVPLRADVTTSPGSFWLYGIGRLEAGVTIAEAVADLTRVHRGMIDERSVNEITTPVVNPILDRIIGEFRPGTSALLGAVSLVLLIACANVAGLMLARSTVRSREVGIRVALGAGRRRIVQQLLTESLLLSTAGTALGTLVGYAAVQASLAAAPENVPRWISFGVDIRVLGFTVLVTVASALVFGLAPAIRVARTDPQQALQAASARSSGGRSRRRALNLLVVTEVALALVLLIGAGLFIAAFQRLQEVDPGFRPENVLAYRISLPTATYDDDPKQLAFYREHLEELESLPGVTSVGAVTHAPLGNHTGNFFEAEGAAPRSEGEPTPVTLTRWITPDYFRAIGINLLAGRTFTAADDETEATPVVVVNETFANHHWPGEDPVGKRVRYSGGDSDWIAVIGITQDVKHYGLDQEMRPGVYLPYAQNATSSLTVVAKTAVDPLSLVDEARTLVRRRDPDLPIYQVTTMTQRLDDSLWARRASSWSFGIFAGVALALAVSGIYGVVSYAVGQRTHEIGIRMALGAHRGQVLRQVMGSGLILVGIGVLLGLVGTFFAARGLASLLFGVSPTDPFIYAAVTILLVAVAALANLMPARRAASISPVDALREE